MSQYTSASPENRSGQDSEYSHPPPNTNNDSASSWPPRELFRGSLSENSPQWVSPGGWVSPETVYPRCTNGQSPFTEPPLPREQGNDYSSHDSQYGVEHRQSTSLPHPYPQAIRNSGTPPPRYEVSDPRGHSPPLPAYYDRDQHVPPSNNSQRSPGQKVTRGGIIPTTMAVQTLLL